MITLELALRILKSASYSGSQPGVPVEAVRLALRVVHPHLQDRRMLEGFWAIYVDPEPAISDTPATYYHDMVKKLLNRGYAIPAELR
jgi:hypothetical protein